MKVYATRKRGFKMNEEITEEVLAEKTKKMEEASNIRDFNIFVGALSLTMLVFTYFNPFENEVINEITKGVHCFCIGTQTVSALSSHRTYKKINKEIESPLKK
jgi:hypothetical protein